MLGKPICEGIAVFEPKLLWLENKGSGRFHYCEAIALSRYEIESAYLPGFKYGGAISVPDEHVSSVQVQ